LYLDPSAWLAFAPGREFALRDHYTTDLAPAAAVATIGKAETELDPDKRLELFRSLQRQLNASNGPYAFLFSTSNIVIASKNLTNLHPTAAGWRVDLATLGAAGK